MGGTEAEVFEFFNPPQSPGIFLGDSDDIISYNSGIGSPPLHKVQTPIINPATIHHTSAQALSAPSSASPAGSFGDSSSEDSSHRKRKSSSDSSHSALTGRDVMMADDTDMSEWKVDELMTGGDGPNYHGFRASNIGPLGDTVDPSKMDMSFNFNDKSMDNDFDFERASSSPSPFTNGPANMDSPEMPAIRFDIPGKQSPKMRSQVRHHMKANSVCTESSVLMALAIPSLRILS